jgi:hypothetical protein
MLAPDRRSLYTDALKPPIGWELDFAVAATYSLDLTTLMAFPLSLALMEREGRAADELRDSVALLEALRLASSKLLVFCHQGAVHAPTMPKILFSLLEPLVYEVRPPAPNGNFHAKFWLLRFVTPDGNARLRLVIPTRNITNDNCWDAVLTLDGVPGRRAIGANRPLRQLVEALPGLCRARRPSEDETVKLRTLAEQAHMTEWEVPEGYDEVHFHAPGLNGKQWLPAESNRLLVISPFLTAGAINALAETTHEPVALIAREEWMDGVDADTLRCFDKLYTLHDQTEPDDAAEKPITGPPTAGLHAKIYILENARRAHVLMGSANATTAALFGANIEIMAELVGPRRHVGIDPLLGPDGLAPLLTVYEPPATPVVLPSEVQAAQQALREAQLELSGAQLSLRVIAEGENWVLVLNTPGPLKLSGIVSACTWPIAREYETARIDLTRLRGNSSLSWQAGSVTTLTSLIAFELDAGMEQTVRFVLNLPIKDLPTAARDAAILRGVLENREGFLRYLMMLLGDPFELPPANPNGGSEGTAAWSRWADSMPLLEELARALHRNPDRLQSVRRLLEKVGDKPEDDIVPSDFRKLWQTFEKVLAP